MIASKRTALLPTRREFFVWIIGRSPEDPDITRKSYRSKWLKYNNFYLFLLYEAHCCRQHVGVRRYSTFLKQMYDLLDDNGVFVLQVAGIRPSWQFEDLIW